MHRCTVHNSQGMETTKTSIDRWMDNEDAVHIYNGILLSHKKQWNNAICSNMDQLEIITLKVKKDRERQTPYDITYTWNVKYVTNENRNRLTDMGNRPVVVKGVTGWRGQKAGRGMDWAFGVTRCKLLHLEWINNKVLLYITGNYIQFPVINRNGKEYKYVYNFCIAQYCKSTILQFKSRE